MWFQNCPQLTNFFAELFDITASHSFTLNRDGTTEEPAAVTVDPLSSRRAVKVFRASLSKAVLDLIQRKQSRIRVDNPKLDTVVFPLVQMGYYGIQQDELATRKILDGLKKCESLCLASGYFNLPPQYIEAILKGQGQCSILAASPQVSNDEVFLAYHKLDCHPYFHTICNSIMLVLKQNPH